MTSIQPSQTQKCLDTELAETHVKPFRAGSFLQVCDRHRMNCQTLFSKMTNRLCTDLKKKLHQLALLLELVTKKSCFTCGKSARKPNICREC